jgi:hypothetical protein
VSSARTAAALVRQTGACALLSTRATDGSLLAPCPVPLAPLPSPAFASPSRLLLQSRGCRCRTATGRTLTRCGPAAARDPIAGPFAPSVLRSPSASRWLARRTAQADLPGTGGIARGRAIERPRVRSCVQYTTVHVHNCTHRGTVINSISPCWINRIHLASGGVQTLCNAHPGFGDTAVPEFSMIMIPWNPGGK